MNPIYCSHSQFRNLLAQAAAADERHPWLQQRTFYFQIALFSNAGVKLDFDLALTHSEVPPQSFYL